MAGRLRRIAVNPARHSAAVIGHPPEPLTGAMAVTVGGELFVAGGQSPAAHPQCQASA
jgi:hypothetical protein